MTTCRKIAESQTPKRNRIDNAAFVRAWQQGATIQAVADALGASYQTVRAKAESLREKGVNLKIMPRAPRLTTLDVEALNALIAPPSEEV